MVQTGKGMDGGLTMTNQDNVSKAREIELNTYAFGEKSNGQFEAPAYRAALEMAEWKDQQLRERLEWEIEKANIYYDKHLNQHELDKHIGAVIALSELLGIKFPTDRLHMRFSTMD